MLHCAVFRVAYPHRLPAVEGEYPEVPEKPSKDPAISDTTDPLTQTSRLSFDELLRVASKGRPRIVVVEGDSLGAMVELTDTPLTIGRDPVNSLVIDAAGVSRRHAVVEISSEGVMLRDLGSKNGTYVNKEPVADHKLEDGDLIFIGSTTLKYLADDNLEHSYYEYLHEITVQDPLTRIPNRRYFDDFLQREIARTRRYRRNLSLLMIDVDHFKQTNDTYGHLCGDSVLRELAEVVSSRLRQSEFLARYGGEEFALVLPETSEEGARTIAENLRHLVEAHEFCCGDEVIPVTVSIGGARWTHGMAGPRDLIALADERLYRAKREGRNRVVF